MRTKLLLVALCMGAALLPSPASARKTLCTQEEFMTQTLEYTPEAWRLALEFNMSCLPKGAGLFVDGLFVLDAPVIGFDEGFELTCTPKDECKILLEEAHLPAERADYSVHFLLEATGGRGSGIRAGEGEGMWTCTSVVAEAFCE